MIQYTLIDPATGEQESLCDETLTRNLTPNCILLREDEHLGIISHRDLVLFSRWCAGEVLARLVDEPDQRVVHVLSLVDRWLEDQQSVTPEELEAAAGAAWAAAHAAWHAQTAAPAAWDALAAHAARAAAHAAWAAEAAAQAAWAAEAAARTAWDAEVASYEAQAQWLVEHLQSEK